jgi:hypothetical protein
MHQKLQKWKSPISSKTAKCALAADNFTKGGLILPFVS